MYQPVWCWPSCLTNQCLDFCTFTVDIITGCVLVAQSCPTLCDPMVCPWNSPHKNTGVGCHSLLQGIFPTRGLNPGLLHCRRTLYPLSHEGSREKQLKQQCDITPHLLEWSWSTKEERTNAGVNVEKREFLYTIDGIISWLQTPWKTVWSFLKNLKIKLRDLVIPLLGLYPRP